MYVGIDIGGTKTLVAVLDKNGVIQESQRFPSSHDYAAFLKDLEKALSQLDTSQAIAGCVGIPGRLNRQEGIVIALGNLPWQNKPIRADIARLLRNLPLTIENDARLAGLSEAHLLKKYRTILFATISTGIGGALIQDRQIVPALQDIEMGKMPLYYGNHFVQWEEFAGGRGLTKRYNKMAFEITSPEDWKEIGEHIAYGLGAVCSILQPEVVVLGGSVGKHADKFSHAVMDFLTQHLHPVVAPPQAVLAAQRPDDAVLYGCYDLARQVYGDAATN